MKAQLEIITPAIAQRLLEANPKNRPVSEYTVERYADDIINGRWKQNGQSIIVSSDGELLDGQHRLSAIIKAAKPLGLLVVRNVDPDSFDTIDSGKARSVSDVLAIRGHANNHVLAGAARLSYIYASGATMSLNPGRVQITDFVERHAYLNEAARLTRQRKLRFPNAPLAAVLFLANEGRQLDEEADEFVDGIITGADLARGDARLALREWETAERMRSRGKISTRAAFGAAARAWNAYAAGKSLTVIKSIQNPTRLTLEIFGFQPSLYDDVPDRTAKRPAPPRVNGRFAPRAANAELGAAA